MRIPTVTEVNNGVLDLISESPNTLLEDGFDDVLKASPIFSVTLQEICKKTVEAIGTGTLAPEGSLGSMLTSGLRLGIAIGLRMKQKAGGA